MEPQIQSHAPNQESDQVVPMVHRVENTKNFCVDMMLTVAYVTNMQKILQIDGWILSPIISVITIIVDVPVAYQHSNQIFLFFPLVVLSQLKLLIR
jgi:hypothetical protein